MEDDYIFFGLKRDCASISELKKRFYDISLIVHPDKNSTNDYETACAEMIKLNEMYRRVKHDLEQQEILKSYNSCDDLKLEQKKSIIEIDKLNNELPSFRDLYFETHDDMKKFNEKFENLKKENENSDFSWEIDNSNIDGYKLHKSEYIDNFEMNMEYNCNIKYNDKIPELIYDNSLDIISIDKLGNLNMNNCYDYKEAHGVPSLLEERLPKEVLSKYNEERNINLEFEKLELERGYNRKMNID
tara:strand:- start:5969 stop:6700 length:732 start_codon:yes stop_codon:yes gene_type:complete